MSTAKLRLHIEALLMASDRPLSIQALHRLLATDLDIKPADIRQALAQLGEAYEQSAVDLVEVAQGWRFQIGAPYHDVLARLWQEKPKKLSRALLETLAIIVYRQPVTRSEIEKIRSVAVSSSIIKNLEELKWIKIVGRREIPGRPALYATTAQFLDDFGLTTLEQLPDLRDFKDPARFEAALAELQNN